MSYDVYGGWRPTSSLERAECEAEPYITPTGVVPQWVLELRAAVASPEVCTCGRFPVRRSCIRCSTKNSVSISEAAPSSDGSTPTEGTN